MENVRCEQGHQWQTDGEETMAVCPICGGTALFGAPSSGGPPSGDVSQDESLADDGAFMPNPDQTLDGDSLPRGPVPEDGTYQLSASALDLSTERTIDGTTNEQVRRRPDETTVGSNARDEDTTGDRTIGVDTDEDEDEDDAQPAEQDSRTIGVDGDKYDEEEAADQDDQTIGVDGARAATDDVDGRTIGVESAAEDEQADDTGRTIGVDGLAALNDPDVNDRTLDVPPDATRKGVDKSFREDVTIGVSPDLAEDGTIGGDGTPSHGTPSGGMPRDQTFATDKTGAWDTSDGVRPKTQVQSPDHTIPGGGAHAGGAPASGAQAAKPAPTAKPAPASTGKPDKKKKRDKKDPLAGKKSVKGYEILGELGRGGMGVVYKARQPGANRVVALKMMLGTGHASREALYRFQIEARAVAGLQHPNIVQLYEVGEEDGCPFFSLEFIEGEALNKKIENSPQTAKDSARLVQQLSEAMYQAHQRGIIHRDLKPANILLTKDGVPKITDFGLAKNFEDKGEGQTRDGAIMGTPSYMAPEQAQGRTKESGPPADIYSLGAILYDMLTGRPPFRGTTLLETLQQVQTMEPVSPMRLNPALPLDLQTICLKALEKDPKKRYDTAGALAEDLRRFQAGEPISARPTPWYERGWKWAKRKPAIAASIAIGVLGFISVLTFGVLWLDSERRAEKDRAEQQETIAKISKQEEETAKKNAELAKANEDQAKKNEAEQRKLRLMAETNFKRAKEAVDNISFVAQDRLRNFPAMEKVRKELLDKAKTFYDQFAKERSEDPTIRFENALAMQRVADIAAELGDPKTAQAAYGTSLDLFQSLPETAEYQEKRAAVVNNLGNLMRDLKRTDEAEKKYREALGMRVSLAAAQPKNDRLALELAKSHNNLGIVLGKTKDAEAEYQKCRKILERLAQQPGGLEYKSELVRILGNLGTLQKSLGQTAVAEKSYLQANKIITELQAREPDVKEHRQALAQNHYLLAELYRDTDAKKAEEQYAQSVKIRTELANSFEFIPTYRQDLAQSYAGLAILYQALGKQQDADDAYDKALENQKRIVARFDTIPDFRFKLGTRYNDRGVMLLSSARLKDAEAALVQARDIFTALIKEHPDPAYEAELAGTYLNLTPILQATGRGKEALLGVRKSLAIREGLAKKNPLVPVYQEELGQNQMTLALMLMSQDPKEAQALDMQAVGIFTKLSKDNAKNPDYRHQLAIARNNLGNALAMQKNAKEAEAEWRAALDIYRGLVADFQDNPGYVLELANRCDRLGVFLVGAKRFPEAEKAWAEAIAVTAALVAKLQDRPELRTELGRYEGNLAGMFAQAGNLDQAEKQYRKALAQLEELEPKLAATSNYPQLVRELIGVHANYANLLAVRKKLTEAETSEIRIVDLREKLVKSFPLVTKYRLEALGFLNDLGVRTLQKEKFAEARGFYEKGVAHMRELTKGPNVAPEMWQNLYLMQLNLATCQAGVKDHAAAHKTVEDMPKEVRAKDRVDHHVAALVARCAGLAEKDAKLAGEQGKELARTYADRCMALLRQAVQNGFQDAKFLQTDDFAAVRDREDFRALVKEVAAKKK